MTQHIKATLSSNRVVLLRQFEMRFQRTAVEIAGSRAGTNQALLGMLLQDEILKQMLYSVDGEELKGVQKEALDKLFDASEYRQLMKVIEQVLGDASTPKIEMVSSSGNISHGSVDTPA